MNGKSSSSTGGPASERRDVGSVAVNESSDFRMMGRWLKRWDPEDDGFWEISGKKTALKNLIFSVFVEHVGFTVWVLWTIIVINLANAGLAMSLSEQFWIVAIPALIGSALRIPYTFAVPRFGGRLWSGISGALLLIPILLVIFLVPSGWLREQAHDVQFWVLFACAATAGFGGGNFSSSMANISFFYPERRKGIALGINAAAGNLGVAVAQIFVPLVIVIGVSAAALKLPVHSVHIAYAGLFGLPLIVLAALCAWLFMDSLDVAKGDARSYGKSVKQWHTWIMSFLYIGTFGSFIGYSFAMPLVIKNTFPTFLGGHPFIATYLGGLAFMGALVGSVSRPLGGWVSDRIGGAVVTLWCFLGMGAFTALAIYGVSERSFPIFLGSYIVIFALSGIGNGSTYRMIPAIFSTLGSRKAEREGLSVTETAADFKRQAAAVVGIAGALGAFGGFLIQIVFRQSSLEVTGLIKAAKLPAEKAAIAAAHADWSISALWVFLVAYAVFAFVTWFFYLRKTVGAKKYPSMREANV